MAEQKLKTVTAQNQFTDTIVVNNGQVSCWFKSSSFVGTLTLQAKAVGDSNADWVDTSITFTTEGSPQATVMIPGGYYYRFGCKTGEYTSGTAYCSIQSIP